MMRHMLAATAAALLFAAKAALATEIAVLTPYISSIPTNDMVQAFQAEAQKYGWHSVVVDTRNDFGQLASRVEDEVAAHVAGIVLVSVDPKAIQDQVDAAAKAGIPVIAIDGAKNPSARVNVTSNNFDLGTQLSHALFAALGGKGNIVKFYHSAHPGVHQRELALDAALKDAPGIKIIADHFVKVPGPTDDARIAMENIIRRYGDSIDGVWAAFDDPGIGAELALAQDLPNSHAIIMGIDGNAQAVDMIRKCTHFKATLKQDFAGMSQIAAAQLKKILDGGKADAEEIDVPAILITAKSLGVTCP